MDITTILTSLSSFGVQLRLVISAFGVLAGLMLFASAGRELLSEGKGPGSHGPSLGAVGVKLFVGAALLQIARSIEDTRTGLLAGAGSEVRTMMAYAIPQGSGGAVWTLLLSTCLVWIATIGAIGMFRGFLLWNKAGSGDSQGQSGDLFWRGLWHVIGGAICINIGTR